MRPVCPVVVQTLNRYAMPDRVQNDYNDAQQPAGAKAALDDGWQVFIGAGHTPPAYRLIDGQLQPFPLQPAPQQALQRIRLVDYTDVGERRCFIARAAFTVLYFPEDELPPRSVKLERPEE